MDMILNLMLITAETLVSVPWVGLR